LTQQALTAALAGGQTDAWLASLPSHGATVPLADVLGALDEVRDDFGADD
jgi:post-segregation antitoxin (ccd killing protein)